MSQVAKMVAERFTRLKLKGEPLKLNPPITEEQVQEVKVQLVTMFPGLNLDAVTKQSAAKCESLTKWIQCHCQERQYCFQIGKCSEKNCCPPQRLNEKQIHWLPDPVTDASGEHYLPLEEIIGTEPLMLHVQV